MNIDKLKANHLIVRECLSGSKAYGLDTETSDTDIKGVFVLDKDTFYGLKYYPQVSNPSNDIVYYELGRYIELLLANNPHILELAATPKKHTYVDHKLMREIKGWRCSGFG